MICPTCGSQRTRKSGRSKTKAQKYTCLNRTCKRQFTIYDKNPRILYFDIETAPIKVEAEVWNIYEPYLKPENIKEDWFILGWAAKWVCESYIYSYAVTPREAKRQNDKRLMRPLWDLFNEADIIVGHNSDNFDIKRVNWRWMVHGYKPPKPYRKVDTLKMYRKLTGATSKSLDYLAKELGYGGKMEHRPRLFHECKAGNADALREMREYNEIDIIRGEEIYLHIRAWDTAHPNMGLYFQGTESHCKNCGSLELSFDEDHPVYTPANAYVCWSCLNCGAHGRTNKSAIDKEKRKSLMK